MKAFSKRVISDLGHRVQNTKTRFFNHANTVISKDILSNLPVMNVSTSKLVVCAMIRDENDILSAWLEHLKLHSAQLFVIDHKSNSDTSDKLKGYVESNGGIYAQLDADGYFQQEAMSFLLRMAETHLPQEAILLPLDADEFVSTASVRVLTKELADNKFACWALRWRNAFPADIDSEVGSFDINSTKLKVADRVAPIWKSATTVAMARRWRLRWAQGNHLAFRFTGTWVNPSFDDDLEILHIPIRSAQQLATKLDKGISEYEARNKDDGNGFHWREIRDNLNASSTKWSTLVANYGQPIDSVFAATVSFEEVRLESFINGME